MDSPMGNGPAAGLLASLRRVLTSELAIKNPWLFEPVNREQDWARREEERLVQNQLDERQESSVLKSTSLVNCLLATNMLKRSRTHYLWNRRGAARHDRARVESHLKCDYCLGQLAAGGWPIGRTCGALICCALFVSYAYCWLDVAAGLRLLFEYDLAIARVLLGPAELSGNLSSAGSGPNTCELSHQRGVCVLDYRDRPQASAHMSELAQAHARLGEAGVPIRSQVGVNLFATLVVLAAPLVLHCLPMMHVRLVGRLIRPDSMTLLYEPVGERRRLVAVTEAILRELAHEQVVLVVAIHSGRKESAQLAEFDFNYTFHELRERHKFIRLLSDIQRRQFVRPVVAASAWHRDLLLASRVLTFAVLVLCLGILAFFLTIYALEIYTRTLDRMARDACARWHPNATLLGSSLYLLDHLFAQVPDLGGRDTYSAIELTSRPFYAVLLAEARHLCTWPVARHSLKLGLLIVAMSFWFAFWSFVYMLGYLDKIAWLRQIRAQLADCHQQVASVSCSRDFLRPDALHVIDRVHRKLAISYANYALLRHQYQPFRCLANFFIFHVCAFNTSGLAFLYLVASLLKSRASHFRWLSVALALGQLVIMNTYMLVSLIDSRILQSIMRQLARLLALSADQPALARKPALILWRRQLLTEEEVSSLASMKILTLRISYSQMVAFNVQLVVLMLLAWRTLEPR